jgi:hypothetical protein
MTEGGVECRQCRRAHQRHLLQRLGDTPPVVGFADDTLPIEGRVGARTWKGRVKS